jgi:hypothetical protein
MTFGKPSVEIEGGEYVALQKCPICLKDIGILLDRKLRKRFPRQGIVIPNQFCDECKEKYLKIGICLINPNSGKLVVIKEEVFNKLFNLPEQQKEFVKTNRFLYCEDKLVEDLIGQKSK